MNITLVIDRFEGKHAVLESQEKIPSFLISHFIYYHKKQNKELYLILILALIKKKQKRNAKKAIRGGFLAYSDELLNIKGGEYIL